jgi:hypothetical protein
MPRPTYQAPPGRLTLRDAAEMLEISYHVAYTRLTDTANPIPYKRDGTIYTIAEEDLGSLARQKSAPQDKRIPVMNRVSRERYAAWERAAGDKPISTWLGELGDRAAGIEAPPELEPAPAPRRKRGG